MDRKAIILGKKKFSRVETLTDYATRYNRWHNYIIGVSAYYGFWAWLIGKLTKRHIVYYCIDFYCAEAKEGKLDSIFIWLSWKLDRFLTIHCNEVWDISIRINEGRSKYCGYKVSSRIVPCCYQPNYFRSVNTLSYLPIYVGLKNYISNLMYELPYFVIDGNISDKHISNMVSKFSMGIAIWKDKHNAYYGDSGKTKLYIACGIPVITNKWTTFAPLIEEFDAGITVNYNKLEVLNAILKIINNLDYYKSNVRKLWKYVRSDDVYKKAGI